MRSLAGMTIGRAPRPTDSRWNGAIVSTRAIEAVGTWLAGNVVGPTALAIVRVGHVAALGVQCSPVSVRRKFIGNSQIAVSNALAEQRRIGRRVRCVTRGAAVAAIARAGDVQPVQVAPAVTEFGNRRQRLLLSQPRIVATKAELVLFHAERLVEVARVGLGEIPVAIAAVRFVAAAALAFLEVP